MQANLLNINPGLIKVSQATDLISENIEKNDFEILDVRTAEEYKEGCINKLANNIDYYSQNFVNELDKLDKEKTYLVYCRSGRRSSETVKLMQQKGFESIYDLDGGIKNWINFGNRIEQC
ncbi:rhodanese-like domain-containing protein [Candidatus Peregrinibacteria bacterium]|nr:rhodanese-like domain-containing protein [Candidatus Peregrinibacteria bacterium]